MVPVKELVDAACAKDQANLQEGIVEPALQVSFRCKAYVDIVKDVVELATKIMNGLKTRMGIGTTKKKLILIRNGNYGKAMVKTRPKHLMLLQKTCGLKNQLHIVRIWIGISLMKKPKH